MRVLVVDDDSMKFGKIHQLLVGQGVSQDDIVHVITASQAIDTLKSSFFDIMLLDINIPRRFGEEVVRGGGLQVLRGLSRNPALIRPQYIIGITAYEDVIGEFGHQFTEELWSLVLYRESSDQWASQVTAKVSYIRAARASGNFRDGSTYGIDLAIVCALESVEFGAVKDLDCGWQPLRFPYDETRYIAGSIAKNEGALSVVAAAAPRMGMPATSVLTSKMIAQFRPRYVAMVGICAGRQSKVSIGDVIVANPSWDWGSGKIDTVKNNPVFKPSPHQVELDLDVWESLKEVCTDPVLLAKIKSSARCKRPLNELRAHFGPLASGASVVANNETFNSLLAQHRDLLGIEMEAYGVVVACKGSGLPRPIPIVMKSVCDFADHDKDDDFQEYAAFTSANLLFEAVKRSL